MGFRALGLTAIALVGGYIFLMPTSEPGIDRSTVASVKAADTRDFAISNLESRSACIVTLGRTLTARSREVSADKDCDTVLPGLMTARNWTQNEDGSVVVSGAGGEFILSLGPSDGVDYEALEPANAVLSVTATN